MDGVIDLAGSLFPETGLAATKKKKPTINRLLTQVLTDFLYKSLKFSCVKSYIQLEYVQGELSTGRSSVSVKYSCRDYITGACFIQNINLLYLITQ